MLPLDVSRCAGSYGADDRPRPCCDGCDRRTWPAGRLLPMHRWWPLLVDGHWTCEGRIERAAADFEGGEA